MGFYSIALKFFIPVFVIIEFFIRMYSIFIGGEKYFSYIGVMLRCNVMNFHLSVCCQMFGVHGSPSPGAIWITTGLGDVFVFDPAVLEVRHTYTPPESCWFYQVLEIAR